MCSELKFRGATLNDYHDQIQHDGPDDDLDDEWNDDDEQRQEWAERSGEADERNPARIWRAAQCIRLSFRSPIIDYIVCFGNALAAGLLERKGMIRIAPVKINRGFSRDPSRS